MTSVLVVFINLAARRKWKSVEEEFAQAKLKLLNGDEIQIERILKTILQYRPRPLTPQMISGADNLEYTAYERIFVQNYAEVLDLATTKISWNLLLPLITDLFVLDGGDGCLLGDAISTLTNFTKCVTGPSTKLDNVASIFCTLLNSDFMTCALVRECLKSSGSTWNELVKLLVAVPSRLANKMGANMPEFFAPANYVYVVYTHVLKCLQILNEASRHQVQVRVEPVSVLISKIVTYSDGAAEFEKIVPILEMWCWRYDYTLIAGVFAHLDGSCVNRIAHSVLASVANPLNVRLVLGDCVRNARWRYSLCDYMLLKSYYGDDKVLVNLISYLRHYEDELSQVLENLLNVWSDKSALNRTPFEQHLYVSKAIVLATKVLSQGSGVPANIVQKRLFIGVPTHLEASEERIRAVGMIVAELVIECLNLEGSKITFEYDDLRKDSKHVIEQIRAVARADLSTRPTTPSGDDPLEMYLSRMNVLEKREMRSVTIIQSTQITSKPVPARESDDESWDSDDELEPYDLSNDVKISALKRPRYLRDLVDSLKEQKDADVWIGSVEACEELVKQQLINDDPCLGIEILSLLLTLERQFFMEDFEQARYDAAVAVVNVYPEQGATYVCEQFHQAAGKYTISHKMLMLDVLVGSARDLAAIKGESGNDMKEQNEWRSIISQRIRQNTKYITKKPLKPVTKANDFNSCVGYYFYPLIRGSAKHQNIMVHLVGVDCHSLLAQYIDALAAIMCSAVNCTLAGKMAVELLEFVQCLKEHSDFKVRSGVLRCIAAVVITVPKVILTSDEMLAGVLRVHSWLEQVISKGAEPNTECRMLMVQVFNLMKTSFTF